MSNTDTTSDLRQQLQAMSIAINMLNGRIYVGSLDDTTLDDILALLTAQKQRWEAAARIDEATTVYNNLRTMYPEEALQHLADRIAALDGVIGEQQ